MLDILILYDDWELAKRMKEYFQKIDAGLKINFTVSRKHALNILAEKNPKVFILNPNFYRCTMNSGMEYIDLIQAKLPSLEIQPFSASGAINELDGTPLIPLDLEHQLQYVDSSIKNALKSDKKPIAESTKRELLYGIPPDYGRSTRLDKVLRDFIAYCKYAVAETRAMIENCDRNPDKDIDDILEAISLRHNELLSIFEELLVILYQEEIIPESITYEFEKSFNTAMSELIPLVDGFEPTNATGYNLSGKDYAIAEILHWIAKIVRFIAEHSNKLDIWKEVVLSKKVLV